MRTSFQQCRCNRKKIIIDGCSTVLPKVDWDGLDWVAGHQTSLLFSSSDCCFDLFLIPYSFILVSHKDTSASKDNDFGHQPGPARPDGVTDCNACLLFIKEHQQQQWHVCKRSWQKVPAAFLSRIVPSKNGGRLWNRHCQENIQRSLNLIK